MVKLERYITQLPPLKMIDTRLGKSDRCRCMLGSKCTKECANKLLKKEEKND